MNYEQDIKLNELRLVIASVLDIDEKNIEEGAHFVKDLGVDSLMALEIMVTLEKKYGVKLTEQELKQITCLKNVYELLLLKTAKSNIAV